jgi:hypothetical protein
MIISVIINKKNFNLSVTPPAYALAYKVKTASFDEKINKVLLSVSFRLKLKNEMVSCAENGVWSRLPGGYTQISPLPPVNFSNLGYENTEFREVDIDIQF